MELALLLALQTASPSAPPAVASIQFDLAEHRLSAQGCGSGNGTEIIVCGRKAEGPAYPMEEMDRRYAPKKVRAEISLGSATVRAFTESATLPRGEISNRIMVGIKLPF